jgi:CRISPR-associated endonuclease/helicase Cas3
LLVYHCLDVAAVGRVWLEQDQPLRERVAFALGFGKNDDRLFQIICAFLALHDFGKFDIRFQSKVPEIRDAIWLDLNRNDLLLNQAQISEFDHGKAGYDLFISQFNLLIELVDSDYDLMDKSHLSKIGFSM